MMMTRNATEFFWVGNHPGIDLVNTEAVDAHGDRLELVPDWTALVDWAQAAGLIDTDLAQQCRAAGERRGRTALGLVPPAALLASQRARARRRRSSGGGCARRRRRRCLRAAQLSARTTPGMDCRSTRRDRSNVCDWRSRPRPSTPPASSGHGSDAAAARAACCCTTTPPRTARDDGATWPCAETGPRPAPTTDGPSTVSPSPATQLRDPSSHPRPRPVPVLGKQSRSGAGRVAVAQ